jgi:hypothetical protein
MKGLEQIEFTLKNYSAISFAETKLQAEKDAPNRDYYTYMRNCYSGKDNPTIEECEQNAFSQFINEYKKCCDIYAGWIDNGKVFILDKRDMVVLFLYKKNDVAHSSVVHYNPLNVDLVEQSCPNNHFFKEFENGRYDMSTKEDLLIKECDELVECSNHS